MKILTTVMFFWIVLQLVSNRLLMTKYLKEKGVTTYPVAVFVGLVAEIAAIIFALKYIWTV